MDYILLGPMLLDRSVFEIFCGISREDGALRYLLLTEAQDDAEAKVASGSNQKNGRLRLRR
jgi:hypothetical protein